MDDVHINILEPFFVMLLSYIILSLDLKQISLDVAVLVLSI